ncbi:NAD(P)H-dependent oxidoreductase [Microcoleus sp. LEGE 07076]|uniref:NAD(P)H-dependent oxidoreductase n=1 Tax=Microcoleus sp. LEGE 07076 TaxID=915322 RepID=UPI001880E0CD|nr:NAD(P)H-dependent oxidoreductase [Microcoleus sp. LEGE 07076]MBE9183577.1 NAD(P)H-dependent oxidoreductase [Microcoleus sp. LEGE 07076]
MNHLTTTDLLEHLKWRYATKQFDPSKTIDPEIWTALEDTLVLTPSSYGLQPWKFLIVTSPELKEQLKPFSWNQSQVTDCSHYVVFTIEKNLTAEHVDRFIARTAEIRGGTVDALSGYRNLIVNDVVHGTRSFNVNDWATRQTYIALGNFMTSAALLGVDTCPMEGIEPVKYDNLLGLPEKGFTTVVACAAGYRSEADKYASLAKVRFHKSEVLEVL